MRSDGHESNEEMLPELDGWGQTRRTWDSEAFVAAIMLNLIFQGQWEAK